MKKIIVIIFLSLICLAGHATVKVYSYSWESLVGQQTMSVQLSLDKIKYKKIRPFKEFLYKARRANDWEAQSLDYFISEFNESTLKVDLELVAANDKNKTKYMLVLVPYNVTGGGQISGNAFVTDTETNETLFSFTFASSDGDDDDEITLRDALKDLGEDFGKLFYKFLKKL